MTEQSCKTGKKVPARRSGRKEKHVIEAYEINMVYSENASSTILLHTDTRRSNSNVW